MKLGSLDDAKLIHRRRKKDSGPIPKGWKLVGQGAYRSCYLSPDGVVYKINRPDAHDEDANNIEFNNYRRIKKDRPTMPHGWKIAPTHMYSFDHDGERVHVIAMKYVKGKHEQMSNWTIQQARSHWDCNGTTDAFDSVRLFDLHEENYVVTPEGTKVIIDLGE